MKLLQKTLLFAVPVLVIPLAVMAQGGGQDASSWCEAGKLCNPLKGGMDLWQLIEFIVRDVLVEIIAPIVITLMLLWSGFLFVTAQGNPESIAKAQRNFFMVIVGAIILLGAYVILEIVTSTVKQITG